MSWGYPAGEQSAGGSPQGPAGGDLGGSYPNPTVPHAAVTTGNPHNVLIGDVFPNPITPPALVADAHNYAPTGIATATSIRQAASGGTRDITGIIAPGAGDNIAIVILNLGPSSIILRTDDANSDPANRFLLAGDITLSANESVLVGYDSTAARWRALSDF